MEFVKVDDDRLPADLQITSTINQPLLVDSGKLRSTLGWTETDPETALRRAVGWELSNAGGDDYLEFLRDRLGGGPLDFSQDDEALRSG